MNPANSSQIVNLHVCRFHLKQSGQSLSQSVEKKPFFGEKHRINAVNHYFHLSVV